MDLMMIGLVVVFFAATGGMVLLCDHLAPKNSSKEK